MKYKQTTTIVYTQEVELNKEEADELVGVPTERESELSKEWESQILEFIVGELDTDQTLTVNTKIEDDKSALSLLNEICIIEV